MDQRTPQQRLSDLIGPYWGAYRIAYKVLQPLLATQHQLIWKLPKPSTLPDLRPFASHHSACQAMSSDPPEGSRPGPGALLSKMHTHNMEMWIQLPLSIDIWIYAAGPPDIHPVFETQMEPGERQPDQTGR